MTPEEEKNKDTISIAPRLSSETHQLLKQRAGKTNLSMNQFIIKLITEHTFKDYEIETHELVSVVDGMDNLVLRASGYYLTMIRQEKLSADLGKHILLLYQRIDERLSSYYKELINNRENECAEEEKRVQALIESADKNTPPDKSVSFSKDKYGSITIRMTAEEQEKMKHNMESSGYDSKEKTRFITDLINSKRFVNLSYRVEDIRTLNQIIYKATKPYPVFIRVLIMQGEDFKELAENIAKLCSHIQAVQKEVWHIVMNDRKTLYQKYIKKIKQTLPKKQNNERRKTYREKGE